METLFENLSIKDLQKILRQIKKPAETRIEMLNNLIENLNLISLTNLQFIVKKIGFNYNGNKTQLIKRIYDKLPLSVKSKIFLKENTKKIIDNIDTKKTGLIAVSIVVFLLGIYKKDTILNLTSESLKKLTFKKNIISNIETIDPEKIKIAKTLLKNARFKKKINELITKINNLSI